MLFKKNNEKRASAREQNFNSESTKVNLNKKNKYLEKNNFDTFNVKMTKDAEVEAQRNEF